jgi:hypothetical protein
MSSISSTCGRAGTFNRLPTRQKVEREHARKLASNAVHYAPGHSERSITSAHLFPEVFHSEEVMFGGRQVAKDVVRFVTVVEPAFS